MKRAALLMWLCLAAPALAQEGSFGKQRVTLQSGELKLVGFLYKPEGAGPFPGMIWNHGSEKDPAVLPQFDAVAAVFVPAGYVVLAPVRRGHSDSEGHYIEYELRNTPEGRRARRQVELLEEQLDDQLAGLGYLRSLPYVDPGRLVVAGCSYGGIQTLLGAERGGYRAALAISPAALSWGRNPDLQNRLVRAAQSIRIPVFVIQPPRDASLEPARVLGREFERLGKPSRAKIYPADIPDKLQTHCFGGIRRGSRVWSQDALDFFAGALR